MSSNRPPKGEPWVWLTRDLLRSDAWRTMSLPERKLIEFLMLENMAKGGKHNGNLKAPYRQLVEFGISNDAIQSAVQGCERRGLIDVRRGGMRVATVYGMTWLSMADGRAPSNRWRDYRSEKQKSATESRGSAATENGGRLAKSATENGGRLVRKSATENGGAFKKPSYQGADEGFSSISLTDSAGRVWRPVLPAEARAWFAGEVAKVAAESVPCRDRAGLRHAPARHCWSWYGA